MEKLVRREMGANAIGGSTIGEGSDRVAPNAHSIVHWKGEEAGHDETKVGSDCRIAQAIADEGEWDDVEKVSAQRAAGRRVEGGEEERGMDRDAEECGGRPR